MAIEKILFGRVQYLKKDYPDQVVIPTGTSVSAFDFSWAGQQTTGGGYTTQKYTLNVKGEVTNMYFCQVPENANDRIYVHVGGDNYTERASGSKYIGVMKSNCIPVLQNGGVLNSLLNHLYQAFRGLLRKQVVVC